MSNSIKIIVVIAAVLAGLPAQAQFLGLGVETNIALTRQDLDIIRQTVSGQVRGRPVGTTAKWSNPASGNSGKIRLVKKFTRDNHQCETLDYRLVTKRRPIGPEHYVLSSCLQPDGQWRLI